jgi:hypothetical protein
LLPSYNSLEWNDSYLKNAEAHHSAFHGETRGADPQHGTTQKRMDICWVMLGVARNLEIFIEVR